MTLIPVLVRAKVSFVIFMWIDDGAPILGFESPAPQIFWYSLSVESYDRELWFECRGIRINAEDPTTCHTRFQFGRSRTTRGDRD
jgi:hypothetical protein